MLTGLAGGAYNFHGKAYSIFTLYSHTYMRYAIPKYQRKSFEVSVIQGQHLVLGSVKSEDTWSQVATNGCTSV